MQSIKQYGTKPIYLKLLDRLRTKKGFVCLNMSNGLIREFKRNGLL